MKKDVPSPIKTSHLFVPMRMAGPLCRRFVALTLATQIVYTGNDRVPFWIVRVPKDIIWGHGGLWSDNSVAMLGALFRIHFPLSAEGRLTPPPPRLAPSTPDVEQLKQDKLRSAD
jgi:hypothetical protein